jgi:hypothetical protein
MSFHKNDFDNSVDTTVPVIEVQNNNLRGTNQDSEFTFKKISSLDERLQGNLDRNLQCKTHVMTTYFSKNRKDWQRGEYVKVSYEYMKNFYESVKKVK